MLLLWAAIGARLVHLQWKRHSSLTAHAHAQRALNEVIPARFGDIVDRHGRLLATTAKSLSLFVDPSRIGAAEAIAGPIARVLDLDPGTLTRRIENNRHRKFLWVQRHLTDSQADQILHLALPDHLWGFREEFIRIYPQGSLAAHILGWRNIDGDPQAGVERTLNEQLVGIDGRRTLVRDARGYVIEVLEEVAAPPKHGRTVTLTLDVEIQRITENEVDRLVSRASPRAVAAVVLDPQSGEVLAMASRPGFDPGHPSTAPSGAWTNHAVSSAFEPGSTIKPCIAAWAVDRQVVSRNEQFLCNRELRMGPRVLHDHRSFGQLDIAGIIAHSSNIGMAQIGQRLGNERLYKAIREFGFGEKTSIELPGESPGIVRPLSQWDRYSTGSVPMGQEIAATPLQLLTAHAALANGGQFITPHLVLHRPGDGKPAIDILARHVIDAQTALWMTSGPMVDVVRRGTARQAMIPGMKVFAKTGTAQKFDAASGSYSEDRYVTSCICGAPADAPRLVVLVTVDEPTTPENPSGGVVAAPVASAILKSAITIIDRSPTPQMFERLTSASDALETPATPSTH